MKTVLISFLLIVISSLSWGQSLNWLPLFQGNQNPYVSDNIAGSPTFTLFNIVTPLTFSKIFWRVTVADINPSDLYALGIGACPNNDCSQPLAPIAMVCDTTPVPLTATGLRADPCRQGSVTLQPGTYAYLGVGNVKNVAKCQGRQGASNVTPFASTVYGYAQNADLEVVNIAGVPSSGFITASAGQRVGADICAISLH